MRYAVIQSGVVINVLRGTAPQGAVQIPEGVYVSFGYRYDGANFTPPTDADNTAAAQAAFTSGVAEPEKLFKLIKAVALWQAQLHGKTPAQARDEVAAIYKTL